MTPFAKFLEGFGTLHDCTVTRFEWNPEARTVTFEIEDIWWNFEGLPEYRGPASGTIVLGDVESVEIEMREDAKALFISEFTVAPANAGRSLATIWFRGSGKVVVDFDQARFPDAPPPA